MEISVKNKPDSLFFTRLFVSERKQIASMADEKSPSRISHRLFATSRSEMEINMQKKMFDTKKMVLMALMAAMGFVLMTYVKFPIKYMGFLEFEVSDVPAVIGGLAYGPVVAVAIVLLKNILHLFVTSTAGVGELANFLVMAAYVLPIALFRKKKNKVLGFAFGTLSLLIVGILVNTFITVPFYIKVCGGEAAVFGLAAATIPSIDTVWELVLLGITPFNLVKGITVSLVGYYTWKAFKKYL